MSTIAKSRWRFLAVIGGLLIGVALVLAACGGSSTSAGNTAATPTKPPTPSPTSTPIQITVPKAALSTFVSGNVYACAFMDTFASGFAGTGGQIYPVKVALSEPDCPTGNVGVTVDNSIEGDVLYTMPQGEVQATFTLKTPSGYSLVIVFTAQKIGRVIAIGNGASIELQRQ